MVVWLGMLVSSPAMRARAWRHAARPASVPPPADNSAPPPSMSIPELTRKGRQGCRCAGRGPKPARAASKESRKPAKRRLLESRLWQHRWCYSCYACWRCRATRSATFRSEAVYMQERRGAERARRRRSRLFAFVICSYNAARQLPAG
eukprot:120436-Chlamydomonas_euryale.AAC.5